MQKKQTVGYDETKKMLNTLRKLNESSFQKKPLVEQVGTTAPSQEQRNTNDVSDFTNENPKAEMKINNDITVINNVDVKLLSTDKMDMTLTDEQKTAVSGIIDNFKSQVSQIVTFEPGIDRKSTRLNSSHIPLSRMPSSA